MSIENKLVEFGNYLLEKCKMKGYDLDGDPVVERRVTHADVCNFKDQFGEIENESQKLPSRFQIGDKVKLFFNGSGEVKNCEVIKVHFSESKVLYDVEVSGDYRVYEPELYGAKKGTHWYTRLYNVDSCFVEI